MISTVGNKLEVIENIMSIPIRDRTIGSLDIVTPHPQRQITI